MQVTTIGLDIAKNVFQVHGIDAAEKVVVRKQLRRRQVLEFFKALPACLVGMEACATAHYWARELTKLGHRVPADAGEGREGLRQAQQERCAADAAAICEAARRPTVRFVQIKSTEQQARLMLHRARDLLMRQRTQVINAMRAFGRARSIVAAQGRDGIKELLKIIASEADARLPVMLNTSLVSVRAGGGASGDADADRIDRETLPLRLVNTVFTSSSAFLTETAAKTVIDFSSAPCACTISAVNATVKAARILRLASMALLQQIPVSRPAWLNCARNRPTPRVTKNGKAG